jgi:hypothetical protein
VELMQWIEHFGRWNVQEFVAKRQDRGMWSLISERRGALNWARSWHLWPQTRFILKGKKLHSYCWGIWMMCRRWIEARYAFSNW